jgi:phenylalanyl-tRNA synthetase beta chain
MKIPFDWLAEFIDITDLEPEALAEMISLKSFEVDSVSYYGAKITGPVIVGLIQEIQPHPEADKLQLASVQIKSQENEVLAKIVCGASNIKVGQFVPVALPGSVVLNRKTGGALPIKIGKIRGIESAGMLCSFGELGLESDEDGIKILPNSSVIGNDVIALLDLKAKAVFDIESRSNRGDALCLMGIAREVSAIIGKPVTKSIEAYTQASNLNSSNLSQGELIAQIQDSNLCSGFGLALLKDLQVKASPQWLSDKLQQAGISSINNIVDIANLVMLEIGQPMHAYDASKLNLKEALVVQKHSAGEAEAFLGLDEKQYQIQAEHMVIKNANKTVAIAGIMGGQETSVTTSTSSVVFEAACFNPADVRFTSRSVGTVSESSKRFERGTDKNLIVYALNRAIELATEIAQGQVVSSTIVPDVLPKESSQQQSCQIIFDLEEFKKNIGLEVETSRAKAILSSLGFKVIKDLSQVQFMVLVPSFRQSDVKRPIDLIEEVARFVGLNNIESKPLPGNIKMLPLRNKYARLKSELVAQGFYESISSSFSGNESFQLLNSQSQSIKMLNPLSKDNQQLRQSLLPDLLQAVSYNQKRQSNLVKLFEIGKIYSKQLGSKPASPETNPEKSTGCSEQEVVTFVVSSKEQNHDWKGRPGFLGDFSEVKAIVELLAEGYGKLEFRALTSDNSLVLHPNLASEVLLNGRRLGFIAKLHPLEAKSRNLPAATFFAELFLETISAVRKTKIKSLSDFPFSNRDFTIDITSDSKACYQDIERVIQKLKLEDLQSLRLVSLYKADKKDLSSLSFRLTFQSNSKSIEGEVLNEKMEVLKKELQAQLPGISFRDC